MTRPTDPADSPPTGESGTIYIEFEDTTDITGALLTSAFSLVSSGDLTAPPDGMRCDMIVPFTEGDPGGYLYAASEPDCESGTPGTIMVLDGVEYEIKTEHFASETATAASACSTTTVLVDGDIEVTMPELGSCD